MAQTIGLAIGVIVLGVLLGHVVLFLPFYHWGRLSAHSAVRWAVLLGLVSGYIGAAYFVPGGGGLLSFVGGAPLPGLYWLAGSLLFAVLVSFVRPGFR